MSIQISNSIIIKEYNPNLEKWIKENLIVDNPVYLQLKKQGKDDTIKFKRVPEKLNLFSEIWGKLVLPFGVLYSIWPYIKNSEKTLNFNSNNEISIKHMIPRLKPFEYQEKAINYMIKAKGGVLCAPCGSGKTLMGIEIFKRIGKKTLWLCHTKDLLNQAKKDMENQYPGIKIGLATDGKLEIGEDVTISTVQTLEKIDKELYKDCFDVVIIDECVHCVSAPTQMKMFGKVISGIPARYKFGLTATPHRNDGMIKAMYAYIGCNPFGKFEPTYKVDRDEVDTMPAIHEKVEITTGYDSSSTIYDAAGMLVYNELINSLSLNEYRNELIIENIIKCNEEGRKQIVLTWRVEHCKIMVEKLQKKGINAVLCVGDTKNKDRQKILNQEIKWDVLVSTYSLLKEGVSIKELDTLHIATPLKEKGTTVQCAGRIERKLENKKQPIIYDYVDMDIPYCVSGYYVRRRSLSKRF